MVRLLHTSDWHLGRFLYGRSLLEDQAYILDRLIEAIDARKPHALLIAGDVFDRALPPEAAVSLFDRFLSEVAGKRGLPVALIPGNHDSCERLGFASRLLRDRGVTIFARLADAFSPIRVRGDSPKEEALIYGIPFVEPVEIAQALGRDARELETPDLAIGALTRAILEKKDEATPAVLLCHAVVVGGETSESERDIFIGGSSGVDARAFDGFAYTALGHLHKPQRAGSDRIRYSGSLLAYSKSEVAHEKSITEVRVAPDGRIEIEPFALPRLRALRSIEGSLAELLSAAADDGVREDFVIAGYTDSGAVVDAFHKLRGFYPNLLHVARTGAFLPDATPALTRARERENLSELELFGEFFRASTGAELSAEEREAVIAAIADLSLAERRP